MRLHKPFALLWAFVAFNFTLSASSVIPFANLGEATLFSECVVLARAVESLPAVDNGITYDDTRFEVLETVKGSLSPNTIFSLRPWSCRVGSYRVDISGDFHPETGKSYLLFLQANGQYWRPVMLSFYVFEQYRQGVEELLVPYNDAGIETVQRPDGGEVAPLQRPFAPAERAAGAFRTGVSHGISGHGKTAPALRGLHNRRPVVALLDRPDSPRHRGRVAAARTGRARFPV